MSSRLQLDMHNLSLGRRHLVNAYEVEAGIGVIAGNTVWSMPEHLECEVLQKARYINTLTFTFTFNTETVYFQYSPSFRPKSHLRYSQVEVRGLQVATATNTNWNYVKTT